MLTIVMIQIVQGMDATAGSIVLKLVVQLLVGAGAGYAFGKFAVWITNRINLHFSSLYPILMLCVIFFTFSMTELIRGNGYLAVYVAGIIVGNSTLVNKRETSKFLDGMTWLFQIVMFLTLGLLVNPNEMLPVIVPALLIGVFLILVGRPLSVFICLLPFRGISRRSKVFLSWVGLRGAAPILFSIYPVVAGVQGAEVIFNVVFFITLLSLLLQGMTVASAAKAMKLKTASEKDGNDFGVELPEDLKSKVWDITVDEFVLKNGSRLMDVGFPKGVLAIMVKRGDAYMVPDGGMELELGDKMLMITSDDNMDPQLESDSPEAIERAGLVPRRRVYEKEPSCQEVEGDCRCRKTILYIHGMGGGGDSRIPSILSDCLDKDKINVVVRTYSFNPDHAYGQIASWMDELRPDLVIGESLGSLQAIRIKGVPHILISPSLNAPVYLYAASFITWLPGLGKLLDTIYRPRPGDRQEIHFRASDLRAYRSHRVRALLRSPYKMGPRADYFFAFFGEKDHYRRSGIVSVGTYEKYFFHSRGGHATYAMYPGTHFMEEEYIRSMLVPKIKEILCP